MSSIHRTGLAIAGAVAALTMAGAILVQGYSSSQTAAAPAHSRRRRRTAASSSLDPEIVYVNPAPTPAIVTVTQTAPPVSGRQEPGGRHRVHVIVPGHAGGDDDGGRHNHGGGDD